MYHHSPDFSWSNRHRNCCCRPTLFRRHVVRVVVVYRRVDYSAAEVPLCRASTLPVVTRLHAACAVCTSQTNAARGLRYDRSSGGGYEEKDATTGRGESLSAMHVSKFRRLTSVDRKRGGHTDRPIVGVVRCADVRWW